MKNFSRCSIVLKVENRNWKCPLKTIVEGTNLRNVHLFINDVRRGCLWLIPVELKSRSALLADVKLANNLVECAAETTAAIPLRYIELGPRSLNPFSKQHQKWDRDLYTCVSLPTRVRTFVNKSCWTTSTPRKGFSLYTVHYSHKIVTIAFWLCCSYTRRLRLCDEYRNQVILISFVSVSLPLSFSIS